MSVIRRELHVLPGFIIGGFNLKIRRHVDDTVMKPDIERNLPEHLEKRAKESENKRLTVNCKKIYFYHFTPSKSEISLIRNELQGSESER